MTNTRSKSMAQAADWKTFAEKPGSSIDPARLDICFEGNFGVDLCRRLLGCGRLTERLNGLIAERYALKAALAPGQVSDADRVVALANVQHLMVLMRRAGAIFWAETIAAAVLAQEVKALHAQLGEQLCVFAVNHRDLSGPKQILEPLDTIATRIDAHGQRCLGAWCHAQPAEIGMRVRLKLPPSPALDDAPTPPFGDVGPAITRCAVG